MSTPAERLRAALESQKKPRVPGRKPGRERTAKTPLLVLPNSAPAEAPPAPPTPRRDLEARAAQLRRELATTTRELDLITAALAAQPA